MGKCNTLVLDDGLAWLVSKATHIYICSQEPMSFADATVGYALGNMNFGAGNCLTGPTNRTPNGRQVSTVAVTSGTVTGSGTTTWWAIVDSVNSQLLVDNALAASQPVTSGNVFSLPSFNFGIPSQ